MPKGIKITKQISKISGVDTVKQVDALKVKRDNRTRKKRV